MCLSAVRSQVQCLSPVSPPWFCSHLLIIYITTKLKTTSTLSHSFLPSDSAFHQAIWQCYQTINVLNYREYWFSKNSSLALHVTTVLLNFLLISIPLSHLCISHSNQILHSPSLLTHTIHTSHNSSWHFPSPTVTSPLTHISPPSHQHPLPHCHTSTPLHSHIWPSHNTLTPAIATRAPRGLLTITRTQRRQCRSPGTNSSTSLWRMQWASLLNWQAELSKVYMHVQTSGLDTHFQIWSCTQ